MMNNKSCLGWGLVGLILLWINGVALVTQLLAWAAPLLGGAVGPLSATLWQVALIGGPLLLLAWLWPPSRPRAAFRVWLGATLYLLLLAPSRFLDSDQSQLLLVTQLALSWLYLAGLGLITRRTVAKFLRPHRTGLLLALGFAALVSYPWLAWGALGSLLDTLLSLALGLTAGLNAALLMSIIWWPAVAGESRENDAPPRRGPNIFSGGLVLGTALLIMASGLSFSGGQLLLMLALPGLGWLALALGYTAPASAEPSSTGSGWQGGALALLIGLATAAIIALTDTDAVLLIALDAGLGWAFRAAGVSLLIGWLLAIVALLLRRWWGTPLSMPLLGGGTLALGLGGLLIYTLTGQPGFYGDRLFVILDEQADVSEAATIPNADQRRRLVYDTLVEQATTSQADVRAILDGIGVDYTPYYLVNALEVRGGLLLRLWLASRPEVDRVLPSPVMRPLPAAMEIASGQVPAPTEPQWNLTNIGADRVWTEFGVRGAGIVIGQADSGVQFDHPDLQSSYRGEAGQHDYHWFDPWQGAPEPVDFGGHGTHTLGSIVGQTVGVAPAAEWIACANLRRNLGNPALYLDCMQFMLAPFPRDGDPFTDGDPTRSAHVLNNSWGCPEAHEGCDPTSLLPAVRALRAAGLFVVVSTGNDGPECRTVTDPLSIYDEVFSVGAVDRFNELAIFSSAGPVTVDGSGRTKPDILAPGVQVLSAFPNSSYSYQDGTSMAGPHVTGVVALLWSANPTLIGDIERTEQILIESATPFTNSLAAVDVEAALTQTFGEEMADEVSEALPEEALTAPPPPESTTCLGQTDLENVPNNVAGYGLVNAYEAVKLALEN